MRRAHRVQGAEVVHSVWTKGGKVDNGCGLFPRFRRLCRPHRPEPLPKLRGCFAMAEEAEGAEIVEITLAAAFGYREDVVGVP